MSEERALALANQAYVPALAISLAQAVANYRAFQEFKAAILKDGTDYATIPGTNKPSLMKPGAEKLANAFALSAEFILTNSTEDWERGFFGFDYECKLWHRASGTLVATCHGSCNTMEARYRWRWVPEHQVPLGLDKATLAQQGGKSTEPDFAIEKAETGGKWGKPAGYWQAFREAIQAGTARQTSKTSKAGKEMAAWEIDSTVYRVPNDDPYTLRNTAQKMAQKRAFVGAVLLATNASDSFTQDMEDFVEGDFAPAPPEKPAPPQQPEPANDFARAKFLRWLESDHGLDAQPAAALASLYTIRGYTMEEAFAKGGKAIKNYPTDPGQWLADVTQALAEAQAAQQSGK